MILMKSTFLLVLLYYDKACNELVKPISGSLRPGYTASFEEMSQQWRTVLATLSPIWPAQDLNIRLPAPETKALLLDQQAGQLLMLEKLLKILDLFVDKKHNQKTL